MSSLDRADHGTVITVFSVIAGCGKTVLATNLAAALADDGRREVCLVDLDLAFGDVGIALQLFPAHTISDAVPPAEVLDEITIEGLLTAHSAGFTTVLAPLQPDAAEAIGTDLIRMLIRLLRARFDYVLIDTPPVLTDHVLAALDQSNLVALVATQERRAVRSLKLALDTLDRGDHPPDRRRIVLNRSGEATELSISEVEAILQTPISAHVPSSRDVPASSNRGNPIVFADPQHPVSEAIKNFAEQLTGPGSDPGVRGDRLSFYVLGERLAAHAQHAAAVRGVTAHLAIHGEPAESISPVAQEGLLRLGFDAITLACKHTGAHNLWVEIHGAPVRIRIEDDGTGPVAKREVSRRLRALAEAADRIGAYLTVGRRDGQGTVIEITAA